MSAPAAISHPAQRAAWDRLWAILLSDDPSDADRAPDPENDDAPTEEAGAGSGV